MADFASYMQSSLDVLDTTRRVDPTKIERAIATTTTALEADMPLLICGNGGSATDAMHIAGELVGRFLKERRALRAIALSADTAILTAWANDYNYDDVFARKVEAYGDRGGALLAISTSGNSPNVVAAAKKARDKDMTVIALTGEGGGKVGAFADILLAVPSRSTPLIQQVHLCIYHYICAEIEERIAQSLR